MGQTRLERVRWFHGRVESLAAVYHRHCLGRDVRHNQHLLRHRRKRFLDAKQQMVRVVDQLRARRGAGLGWAPRLVLRQMGPQHRRVRHVLGLRRSHCVTLHWLGPRRTQAISPSPDRCPHPVDLLLFQYLQQTCRRRT